jgi:xylulokinase
VEGVAFNLYTGLRAFMDNGATIDSVDAIGGAANSSELLAILADIWGLPVHRRNLVDEATALGAAVVGGVGVGLFEDFEVAEHMSERTEEHRPTRTAHDRYRGEHETFLDAYRRLEPWFDML